MSSLTTAQKLFSHPETRRRDTSTQSLSSISSPNLSSEEEGDTASEASKIEDDPFPDFLWMTTEEPHRSRRIAIMKVHPEVRKLMGPTRLTALIACSVLFLQITIAILLRNTHPFSLPFILTAYIIGGTANQNTFLAIHEITHNLAFKSIRANKLLAITANLAIGVPYAMAFKGYHIEHHKFLGEDGIDTDLPSRIEAIVLNNVAGKTFFATFQLLFYALRPGFIRSQTPTKWHAINLLAVLSFDALLVHFSGWKSLIYLIMSSFFAGSLHPCAAHFIAEHYLMEGPLDVADGDVKGLAQETTSYYGWLNILCYNVGYHNEHHDFPSVPWTRLPALRSLAKEFYEPLPSHKSWPYVTWKFITDPSVGMWSRAKRTGHGEKLEPTIWSWSTKNPSSEDDDDKEDLSEDIVIEQELTERGYASDRETEAEKKTKIN
ncbi:fatty acid desaturase-domain-containing protein [Naematelia encephala]|uniref:sphingolipid 4-desaturase n=1 Tax=Naematelia encephala TaxID=71784 RepID=A0A1Y2AVH6_9TREE|nr:fatty acid desaturase-domain-containing protein [Naematelia encephala]